MTKDFLSLLKLKNSELIRYIDEPLSIDIELPHVAYIETKKEKSQVLVFTKPIMRDGSISDLPVVMNLFANREVCNTIFNSTISNISDNISEVLNLKAPVGLFAKIKKVLFFLSYRNIFPKKMRGKGKCQEVIYRGSDADLNMLPILKTWDKDGGPFITMGQVYTVSLDGTESNLGLYRLQQYSSSELGMHFQIHKDSSNFFNEYRENSKNMPVTIAIGGDPLYVWCGQAPLPRGIFELLLFGFIRKRGARLVKSITNDIYIPSDCDIVIEGYIDTKKFFKEEGPFGDHTGYYTLKEIYPYLKVTAISMASDPMFNATVVGKPPLEDKHMGYATEVIFKPMLKTTITDILDYHMPENGVFHNLIIVKIKNRYKGHALQVAHAMWGIGQMSFVKHIIAVGNDAPVLTDYKLLIPYILSNLSIDKIHLNDGILDALDHSSNEELLGGKLLVDCTIKSDFTTEFKSISNDELLLKLKEISNSVIECKVYENSNTPVAIISVDKVKSQKDFLYKLDILSSYAKIFCIVDSKSNSIDNPYMLIWRITNNIDSHRDIVINKNYIAIDATNKSLVDGYNREWPDDIYCDIKVLKRLKDKKIIDFDDDFIKRHQLIEVV